MPSGLSLPLAFGINTRLICLSASASSPSHRSTPYASISRKVLTVHTRRALVGAALGKRKAPSLIPALKDLFEHVFNQKAKVTQGQRARFITMREAGLQQFSIQFAKGDPHARRDAFRIAERLGSEFLTPKKAFDETLAGDRQAILDAYVARQTHRKVSAAPSPVFAPPELLDDDTPDEADEK
jgi:hypothetical protein